jgi:hypothetical protein
VARLRHQGPHAPLTGPVRGPLMDRGRGAVGRRLVTARCWCASARSFRIQRPRGSRFN